ncbi:hypothetical protein BJY01DRAFT_242492 [Aspergillus pseudoustus]|uniref:Serine hydrolase domain-containing protein n=1 Tax=Aspergillus pseudoustus TaxID=1810923 RepID=A0ABR4KXU8_9EURO
MPPWLGYEYQDALITNLTTDNTATFHHLEGDIDSAPDPGITADLHEPSYYSYYPFPRPLPAPTHHTDDPTVLAAYSRLSDVLASDGPFDGLLGFSAGGTLTAGFLIHHAKTYPDAPPPVRCAVFINRQPFRMDVRGFSFPVERGGGGVEVKGEIVVEDGLRGYITIPTVCIAGRQDPLLEYLRMLYEVCGAGPAGLVGSNSGSSTRVVVHERGHEVPNDLGGVALMAGAIRRLAVQVPLEG